MRYLSLFIALALVLGSVSTAFAGDGKIKFETLPEDSEYIATYSATFCNGGMNWSDYGSQKKPFLGFFFQAPKVYTSYLGGCNGQTGLTLSAKKGWKWIWEDASFFDDRGGYILVKDN